MAQPVCSARDLDPQRLAELRSLALDLAEKLNVTIRDVKRPPGEDVRIPIPFSLFPSPVPSEQLTSVIALQPAINLLIHRVAYHPTFLTSCLRRIVEIDPFTRQLFAIYQAVTEEGLAQPLSLGLFRSDYMLHHEELKQVEVNTISSGLAGLAPRLEQVHRKIMTSQESGTPVNIPSTTSDVKMAMGLLQAWYAYGVNDAVLLFLVDKWDFNATDQEALADIVQSKEPLAKVMWADFSDLFYNGGCGQDRVLRFHEKEVAVVYFRIGYSPKHYGAKEWAVRLFVERSRAIKCPSIQYHLAGCKKVQQELAKPEVLCYFIKDPVIAHGLLATFGAQFSLELTPEGEASVQLAKANPDKYVLKPQREGGGNNLYGQEMVKHLEMLSGNPKRAGYILMEKFEPPASDNYIVRHQQPLQPCSLTHELGIFGVILGGPDDRIILNTEAGHLLRSKIASANEGGLAIGRGAMSSVYLQ